MMSKANCIKVQVISLKDDVETQFDSDQLFLFD
jgi:hypothetical protein